MSCFDTIDCIVRDAVDGLLLLRPDLCRLEGGPAQEAIVTQKTLSTDKVAVLSGGGAGHEPAHVALVGKGLLSVAVSGNVFASPNSSTVLRAIRHAAAATPAGVLVIIKNYTGDRLAFGIAIERARAEGVCVDAVLVADDAVVQGGIGGRRGLAGTLLVQKVAGALADAGEALTVVSQCASAVAECVATAGASFSSCHVPGQSAPESKAPAELDKSVRDHGGIEFGMGIHGEPGAQLLPVGLSASSLARALAASAAAHSARSFGCATLPVGTEVAVVINNLGGLSQLELCVFVKATVQVLTQLPGSEDGGLGLRVVRLYSGALLTSLDMRGVSLTLLPVHLPSWSLRSRLSVLQCLDATTQVPVWEAVAWHHTHNEGHQSPYIGFISEGESTETLSLAVPGKHAHEDAHEDSLYRTNIFDAASSTLPLAALTVLAAFTAAAESLVQSRAALNDLDAFSGDGDAGTTSALIGHACISVVPAALDAVTARASTSDMTAPDLLEELLLAAGVAVTEAAGGTSGALYAIMISAAAAAVRTERLHASAVVDGVRTQPRPTIDKLCNVALSAAVAAVSQYGGAAPGDRTLVDALLPAYEALSSALAESGAGDTDGVTPRDIALRAATAAARGRDATALMPRARAGRAAYVREDVLIGHADPGAAGVALWIAAISKTLHRPEFLV